MPYALVRLRPPCSVCGTASELAHQARRQSAFPGTEAAHRGTEATVDEQATQRFSLVRNLFCVRKALYWTRYVSGFTFLQSISKRLGYAQEPKGQTSIQELAKYFHLPINVAGSRLGICPTVLKKICRKHGLSRWPHRKVSYNRRGIENLLSC